MPQFQSGGLNYIGGPPQDPFASLQNIMMMKMQMDKEEKEKQNQLKQELAKMDLEYKLKKQLMLDEQETRTKANQQQLEQEYQMTRQRGQPAIEELRRGFMEQPGRRFTPGVSQMKQNQDPREMAINIGQYGVNIGKPLEPGKMIDALNTFLKPRGNPLESAKMNVLSGLSPQQQQLALFPSLKPSNDRRSPYSDMSPEQQEALRQRMAFGPQSSGGMPLGVAKLPIEAQNRLEEIRIDLDTQRLEELDMAIVQNDNPAQQELIVDEINKRYEQKFLEAQNRLMAAYNQTAVNLGKDPNKLIPESSINKKPMSRVKEFIKKLEGMK